MTRSSNGGASSTGRDSDGISPPFRPTSNAATGTSAASMRALTQQAVVFYFHARSTPSSVPADVAGPSAARACQIWFAS